jgi:lipid II:glycine glycyltransferase (peptidoglycan interpeptide bridge formation enzyme)
MTDALRRLGDRWRAVLCKIDPYVTPPDASVRRALLLRGYTIGHRRGHFDGMQPRFNIIVPLKGGPEAVLARCHHKTRYNIRLAVKRGVTVERGGRGDLATFHQLLMVTCDRDGFRDRTLPHFPQVGDSLSLDGRVELYLARYQGRVLAAAVLLVGGQKAVYAYGASANEQREVMASYALQWAMICRACERGCWSYDMTGIPKHLHEGLPGYGLYRFKRGFWPEVSEFTGEWDLPLQPRLYRLWNIVEPTYWGTQVFVRRAVRALHPSLHAAATEHEER